MITQVRQVNPSLSDCLAVCLEVVGASEADLLMNMILHAACAQERFPLMFYSLYKCLLGVTVDRRPNVTPDTPPRHDAAQHAVVCSRGSQDGGQNVSGCLSVQSVGVRRINQR